MNKAFVETTVLTDALLKSGIPSATAKSAIARFDISLLPVYAIKEFKAGPLRAFVWVHNKLVSTGSFAATLDALQRLSRTPQRYLTSTAIEALRVSAYSTGKIEAGELLTKFGSAARMDAVQSDEYRLAIRTAVMKAWQRRRRITSQVVEPLSCYEEKAPYEKYGLLHLNPRRCQPIKECCLAPRLRLGIKDLEKLKSAVEAQQKKPENIRRLKALHDIIRKPRSPVSEETCRRLGDAIFAFFAPPDAVILTTNKRDLEPLAAALSKQVEGP